MNWYSVEVLHHPGEENEPSQVHRGWIYAASEESARTLAPHWASELGKNRRNPADFTARSVVLDEKFVPSTGIRTETRSDERLRRVTITHLRNENVEVGVERFRDMLTDRWDTPTIRCPGRGGMGIQDARLLREILSEAVKVAEAMEDEDPTIHWSPEDEETEP